MIRPRPTPSSRARVGNTTQGAGQGDGAYISEPEGSWSLALS